MTRQFAMIPVQILENESLTLLDRVYVAWLNARSNGAGESWYGAKATAAALGVSRKGVLASRARLVTSGLLRVKARYGKAAHCTLQSVAVGGGSNPSSLGNSSSPVGKCRTSNPSSPGSNPSSPYLDPIDRKKKKTKEKTVRHTDLPSLEIVYRMAEESGIPDLEILIGRDLGDPATLQVMKALAGWPESKLKAGFDAFREHAAEAHEAGSSRFVTKRGGGIVQWVMGWHATRGKPEVSRAQVLELVRHDLAAAGLPTR